jgi:hypothetical protein
MKHCILVLLWNASEFKNNFFISLNVKTLARSFPIVVFSFEFSFHFLFIFFLFILCVNCFFLQFFTFNLNEHISFSFFSFEFIFYKQLETMEATFRVISVLKVFGSCVRRKKFYFFLGENL